MEDARNFLELISNKHAHKLQANKNNSNISRSRRTNHGEGNQNSHQGGGKPNAKSKDSKTKKLESHSAIWTKKIQPNKNGWMARKNALMKFSDSYKAGRNKNSAMRSELTKEHLGRPSLRTSPT